MTVVEIKTPKRSPFPLDKGNECPNCGLIGTIQITQLTSHWWNLNRVENGIVYFNGEFDWGEDSHDEHITCYSCGGEWEVPDQVEYI